MVAQISTPDADQVAKNLKVSHFKNGALTEKTLYVYALSQVRRCHITPEELEVSLVKTIHDIEHFWNETDATKFQIQH